jgi:signal transduction histidine kinase
MASRSRLVLIGSFAGLILFTTITGIAGLLVLGRARAQETELQARYVARGQALERLRNSIYTSDSLARDYFADPQAVVLKARLAQLSADSRSALETAQASPSLRGEVAGWWRLIDLMTEMAERGGTGPVGAYFAGQLAGRREAMLRITAEIGSAMQAEWRSREEQIGQMYSRFSRILAWELLLVVLAGTALAAAAIRRLGRLEAETRSLGAQLLGAQEQERRAIARELHDDLGQSLTALRLDLGAAAAACENGAARSRLDAAAANVECIVEEVRRMALSLRPSMLDDLGLVAALEWQARELGGRTGSVIEVQAEESAGRLSESQRTCIYRVAQEALQNAVRHAAARKIRVGLNRNGTVVSLRVEDDGRGFTPGRTRGLGLLGMEERVRQLDGRLRVTSAPGHGTTIIAELPL